MSRTYRYRRELYIQNAFSDWFLLCEHVQCEKLKRERPWSTSEAVSHCRVKNNCSPYAFLKAKRDIKGGIPDTNSRTVQEEEAGNQMTDNDNGDEDNSKIPELEYDEDDAESLSKLDAPGDSDGADDEDRIISDLQQNL